MPKTGKPHWGVAVAFLEEALHEHLTQKDAADRIDKLIARNPGVGWGGWLDPPTDTLTRRIPTLGRENIFQASGVIPGSLSHLCAERRTGDGAQDDTSHCQ